MRALVTGAAGFIGSCLVRRLVKEGASVRALTHQSRVPTDTCPEGVELFPGDVREPAVMSRATAGVDEVYHLAARVHALAEQATDHTLYQSVNVEGTRAVLAGAIAAKARAFVLVSSVKAMGETFPEGADEALEPRPLTPYGVSKRKAERLVLAEAEQAGLHAACLRLPLVYGPGSRGNLKRMLRAVDRGRFPPLPEGGRRSIVHVENVVDALLLAARQPAAEGQVYLVTDEHAWTTRELHALMARALGRPAPSLAVPRALLTGLGWLGDLAGAVTGRRMPFDSDTLDKLLGAACFSSARIRTELGFQPRRSFDESLPELIAWYREAPR